jgi:hypothetical protein
MKNVYRILAGAAAFALPTLTFAQVTQIGTLPGGQDALGILQVISQIFGVVIPILVTLAVIYVIVGVIKYATASDDETQATARKSILHGIIALFVIVSIWGLVAILNQTFGVGQGGQNTGNCQPVWNGSDFVPPPNC